VKHVFIVDPLPSLLVEQDTTIAFMREAARRGEKVWAGQVEGLGAGEGGRPYVWAAPIALVEGDPWYVSGESRPVSLHEFDVVWMRKDPPYDLDYFFVTHLLELVPPPTLVVNDPRGLRDVTEKLSVLRYPDLFPETLVSRGIDELRSFQEKLGGEMIIKPLDGCGGAGVFHLTAGDRNVQSLLEMATDHGRRYQMAQRYVPEVREGDKRIILVEGRPVGAVLRVPMHYESRANFHVGGSPEKTTLTEREIEICATIGPDLERRGIVFAGIDVIGDWLTEINVTSPTGIREINALDGVRLETQVLDAVERRVDARR
jgi:glutathione synthase